jgi:metallo-beta-lactamase class B
VRKCTGTAAGVAGQALLRALRRERLCFKQTTPVGYDRAMLPQLAVALLTFAATPTIAAWLSATEPAGQAPPQPQQPAAPAAPAAPPGSSAVLRPDPPTICGSCAEWNAPRPPFKVFGNTYFVGSMGLSSLLIATEQGLVLVDVALPQSAAPIDASIRARGFRTTDVKFILTSHGHFDHVGGVRAMQRYTGATVLASGATARALALGHPVPEDPQFAGSTRGQDFPALSEGVRVVKDGEIVRLGRTAITAHYTPGHTPGATTWTWQSCEGTRCLDMVYVDSLTAVSSDTFRFTESGGLVESFRASLRKVSALPCDVILSTHPGATGMDDKLARRTQAGIVSGGDGDPFVDAGACRALASRAMAGLDDRVARESGK